MFSESLNEGEVRLTDSESPSKRLQRKMSNRLWGNMLTTTSNLTLNEYKIKSKKYMINPIQ